MTAQIDHLVIAATTLDEGVAWCERTLGITPGAGGKHSVMGTHNRLFSIVSPAYPTAYFEIIAIDKGAFRTGNMGAKRWFDLDSEELQKRVQRTGPQLIHFVASTQHAVPAVQALTALGIERGGLLCASRDTPHGVLSWQITVRHDGQRLMNGTLPSLIEWGNVHPTQHMAASGVTLQSLTAMLTETDELCAAYSTINLQGVGVSQGQPNLIATLQTPRGPVTLESRGI